MYEYMKDVNEFYGEAQQYLRTAKRGLLRPQIFTPTILYNITALAFEKYCMAFLSAHGRLPDGHTLMNLAEAVGQRVELDVQTFDKIRYFDSLQHICFLEQYNRNALTPDDIRGFLALVDDVVERMEAQWPTNRGVTSAVDHSQDVGELAGL
jgi:HEPN domain-containing protein